MDMSRDWWLSIDPGADGTGIAVWHGGTLNTVYDLRASRPSMSWNLRVEEIVELFDERGAIEYVTAAYCERPQFFHTAKGGEAAASDSLTKLSHVTGMLHGICVVRGVAWHFVDINKWKGNLPKKLVRERVLAQLGDSGVLKGTYRSHVYDAIGIGLYVLGRF